MEVSKNELIVVEQLPVIKQYLNGLKAEVTEKVEAALSLVCTEDTVKAVKKARAELNADFKYWEEKRKEVKTAIMSPYDQFEAVYRECITDVFRSADSALKDKIDTVESQLKEQKAAEVKAYFEELCAAASVDFITFENARINVTLSESMKRLKEQAKAFVDRVCDDLALIETQEHKDEILYEYKQSLNVSAAITTVSNRYKAIEAAKAREEERKALAEAEKKAAEKVEALVQPTIAPPVEEEKIFAVQFTVKGTRAKLKALKEFLINGGYEWK